jgi:hypothetical protein
MCEHLLPLDEALQAAGIKETFRGQAWTKNCREWVYYDCVLPMDQLRRAFSFGDHIKIHVNLDQRSGTEAGFVCTICNDGVMGLHPAG